MTYNNMKKLMISAVAMTAAIGMGTVAAADIPETIWEYTEEQGKALIKMDFEEIRIFLPVEWDGLYGFDIEEDYVEFYQEESRAIAEEEGMEGGGVLFTICYAENLDFMDYLPDYHIVGFGQQGVYYITVPTDVQCLGEDQETWDEWLMLTDGVQAIIESAVITKPGDNLLMTIGFAQDDEYILPESSERLLEEKELEGMTADEAQMAINEIYARHGRKFLWKNVQKYFDSRSWYEGKIEANDFDPASMSYLEWQNIELLIAHINKLNPPPVSETEIPAINETEVSAVNETEAPEIIEIKAGTEVLTTVYLNLRELPSNQGKVLLVVPKGTALVARGAAVNGWLPVAYDTEETTPVWGFVWAEYALPVTVIE